MKLKDARRFGVSELSSTSPTAALDTDVLLMFVTGLSKAKLLTEDSSELSQFQIDQFKNCIERRKNQEPVAYIVGTKEFWGLEFKIDERVLVPRPETELLVTLALDYLSNIDGKLALLELGIGSGCVAIAIAYELRLQGRDFSIVGVDSSNAALELAGENIERHGMEHHISLVESDWYSELSRRSKFNLIVSNPPYVADGDSYTSPELQYEPSRALYSGPLGLDAIKLVVKGAAHYLHPGGLLLFEHGYSQRAQILSQCSSDLQQYTKVWTEADLEGRDRVTGVQL